ncbi:MAG: cyclic nucleotide-binding domain-containing protein [Spirochaetales bacterium]|nr:cyclic nucleotide-binding domain-containing protein [Spirochaetales bacterium]
MDLLNALKKSAIFEGLDDKEIGTVAGICTEKSYDNGAVVFGENSTDCGMYILVLGQVDIQMNIGIDSELATVCVIREGEVFGELSLVDRAPRSATAKSAGNSTMFLLEADAFEKLVETHSRIGYIVMKNIAKIVSTRLRETNIKYTESLIWGRLSSGLDQ